MNGHLPTKAKKLISSIYALVFTTALISTATALGSVESVHFLGVAAPANFVDRVAPRNGVVTLIHKSVGDDVEKGDFLGWYHSKGKNIELRAPTKGAVAKVHAKVGEHIMKGDPIFTIAKLDQLVVWARFRSKSDSMDVGDPVFSARTGERFGTVKSVEFDRGFLKTVITPVRSEGLVLGESHYLKQ